MKQVYLVGTHHPYQVACTEFDAYLSNVCRQLYIRAIGEEMNTDGLEKEGAHDTVGKRLSSRLNLTHRYCDPDESKRAELGIKNRGIVKAQALFDDCTPDETEAQIQDEYRKREQFWLQQLNKVLDSPILFICGSGHTDAFHELLNKSGYHCRILVKEWTPKKNHDSVNWK